MFVTASARGRGAGASILRDAEAAATGEGMSTMQLETGVASKEALALYRRAGYRERTPFGSYHADPLSVFMERELVRALDSSTPVGTCFAKAGLSTKAAQIPKNGRR